MINPDKHVKAGPGTGSMGGKCSVCGDRATKVRSVMCTKMSFKIIIILVVVSFDTACTLQPLVSHVELSSEDHW